VTRFFLFLVLLILQSTVMAESMPVPEALEAGKTFGNDGLQQSQDLSTNQSADTVPNYQGTNVPETQYANNPMAIEDTARTQLNQNDTGAYVSESATTRPQFQFDKDTDPLFTRSAAIEDNPQSVAGSITGEFSGCQSSTIGTPPQYAEETCVEWRESQLDTCQETLQLSWHSDDIAQLGHAVGLHLPHAHARRECRQYLEWLLCGVRPANYLHHRGHRQGQGIHSGPGRVR